MSLNLTSCIRSLPITENAGMAANVNYVNLLANNFTNGDTFLLEVGLLSVGKIYLLADTCQ